MIEDQEALATAQQEDATPFVGSIAGGITDMFLQQLLGVRLVLALAYHCVC